MSLDYYEMRKKVNKLIQESGLTAFDVARIAKDLCRCRTCKFYVPHYSKNGIELDLGHCIKNNTPKRKRPNMESCGHWEVNEEID